MSLLIKFRDDSILPRKWKSSAGQEWCLHICFVDCTSTLIYQYHHSLSYWCYNYSFYFLFFNILWLLKAQLQEQGWCFNYGIKTTKHIGEQPIIIPLTLLVTIATLWPIKNTLNFVLKHAPLIFRIGSYILSNLI